MSKIVFEKENFKIKCAEKEDALTIYELIKGIAEYEKMLEKANYVEELVVVDNNLITSRGPATTMLFAYKLVDILGGDSTFLKEGMLWNKLEEE